MLIGGINIINKVVCAPMAGVTDKAFRILAREYGCGLIYTEMVSAKALTFNNHRTKLLIDISEEEPPVAVQLFGSEPDIMAEAAIILEELGANIIDINMGCPVPKVVKNFEGSALMLNPQLAESIVSSISKRVNIPVTVKIRKGWDDNNINAVDFAIRLQEAGAKAVAIHGRTRDQYYAGRADWDIIKEVKKALQIPLIGNGDVWSPEDGIKMLQHTRCDAIMIGRGAMGNPWLFKRVTQAVDGYEIDGEPSASHKILGAIKHLDLMIKFKEEKVAVKEMRKHAAWYIKGLRDAAKVRDQINKAETRDEMVEQLMAFLERIKI